MVCNRLIFTGLVCIMSVVHVRASAPIYFNICTGEFQTSIPESETIIPEMSSTTLPWGLTFSSSSSSATYASWKAFDGDNPDATSKWVSQTGQTHFIGFEFPMPTPVVEFVVEADPTMPECLPTSFSLQAWDENNSVWVSVSNNISVSPAVWELSGYRRFCYSSGVAGFKKYRILIMEVNGGSRVSIRDIDLHRPADVAPFLCSENNGIGSAVSSSEYNSTYPAWKAFDGNEESGRGSRWISGLYQIPAWIECQLYTHRMVRSYYLKAEWVLNDRGPKDWTLEGWDETNQQWVVVDQRSGMEQSKWTHYGQYFTVSNPGYYQRYRVHVTEVCGSDVVSLLQIKLFEQ